MTIEELSADIGTLATALNEMSCRLDRIRDILGNLCDRTGFPMVDILNDLRAAEGLPPIGGDGNKGTAS